MTNNFFFYIYFARFCLLRESLLSLSFYFLIQARTKDFRFLSVSIVLQVSIPMSGCFGRKCRYLSAKCTCFGMGILIHVWKMRYEYSYIYLYIYLCMCMYFNEPCRRLQELIHDIFTQRQRRRRRRRGIQG